MLGILPLATWRWKNLRYPEGWSAQLLNQERSVRGKSRGTMAKVSRWAAEQKIYLVSRLGLAGIWLYHGLVPKLLFGASQEVEMNTVFMPFVGEKAALISSGIAEVVFAILLLAFYRVRWFNYVTIAFGSVASLAILVALPHLYTEAFNPFSTNLAIVLLAVINLMSAESLPKT